MPTVLVIVLVIKAPITSIALYLQKVSQMNSESSSFDEPQCKGLSKMAI